MKVKDEGSALVFSVLILSFFLALSLNIYFLARKKAESAGVKVKGERITSNIDMASSLGYQELFMAENFVRLGFPYDELHDEAQETYSTPESDEVYFDPLSGTYNDKYPGIQLTDLIDYFTSHWDYEVGGVEHQKLIMSEDVVTKSGKGVVESRMWQSGGVPEKAVTLWSMTDANTDSEKVSIGGYHLTILEVNGVAENIGFASNPQEIIEDNLINGTQEITATYTKYVTFKEDLDPTTDEDDIEFKFEVKEKFYATGNSSTAFGDLEFYGRGINKFSIKYIGE